MSACHNANHALLLSRLIINVEHHLCQATRHSSLNFSLLTLAMSFNNDFSRGENVGFRPRLSEIVNFMFFRLHALFFLASRGQNSIRRHGGVVCFLSSSPSSCNGWVEGAACFICSSPSLSSSLSCFFTCIVCVESCEKKMETREWIIFKSKSDLRTLHQNAVQNLLRTLLRMLCCRTPP